MSSKHKFRYNSWVITALVQVDWGSLVLQLQSNCYLEMCLQIISTTLLSTADDCCSVDHGFQAKSKQNKTKKSQ